jgi:hypothetical protein
MRRDDPQPAPNDHHDLALLDIQVLVEDERSGQYDAIPPKLRSPVFFAAGDLTAQYDHWVFAARTAHFQRNFVPANQAALDANDQFESSLRIFFSAVISLQHGTTTACPGLELLKYAHR